MLKIEKVGNLLQVISEYVVWGITKEIWSYWKTRMIKNWEKSIRRCNWNFFLRFGLHQQISRFSRGQNWSKWWWLYPKSYQQYYLEQPTSGWKASQDSRNSQISDETPAIAINAWDKLPDEIVEKILMQASRSSDHVWET